MKNARVKEDHGILQEEIVNVVSLTNIIIMKKDFMMRANAKTDVILNVLVLQGQIV